MHSHIHFESCFLFEAYINITVLSVIYLWKHAQPITFFTVQRDYPFNMTCNASPSPMRTVGCGPWSFSYSAYATVVSSLINTEIHNYSLKNGRFKNGPYTVDFSLKSWTKSLIDHITKHLQHMLYLVDVIVDKWRQRMSLFRLQMLWIYVILLVSQYIISNQNYRRSYKYDAISQW